MFLIILMSFISMLLFFGAAADQSAGQLAWVVRNMRLFGVGALVIGWVLGIALMRQSERDVATMEDGVEADQVSAKSPAGAALKYIAKYWDGLILFLTDGRIEMESNAVERTIRPIALQRKKRALRRPRRRCPKLGCHRVAHRDL